MKRSSWHQRRSLASKFTLLLTASLTRCTRPDRDRQPAVNYGYDAAGNRTQAGTQTFTYDQPNRLLTGPSGPQTWTARGTLASVAGGLPVTFDALHRMTSVPGTVTYTYDGLDRPHQRTQTGQASTTYTGTETDPTTDGTNLYGRSPTGKLWSVNTAGTGLRGTSDPSLT